MKMNQPLMTVTMKSRKKVRVIEMAIFVERMPKNHVKDKRISELAVEKCWKKFWVDAREEGMSCGT